MEATVTNGVEPPIRQETIHTLIMKGGGVKGIAFAGAVKVLQDSGYKFDTFVGTSAGAVAAALFSVGYSADEVQKVLYDQPFGRFLDAHFLKAPFNLIIRGGLYPGKALKTWIDGLLRDKLKLTNKATHPILRLQDLDALTGNRLILFASHLRLGTIVYDSKGERNSTEVAHAVRLSASIPGIFIPGDENGYPVYDGGLLNNFPVTRYQQVRGRLHREPETDKGMEDFIALYIDDGDRSGGSAWWFSQAFNIMMMRDENAVLQEHKERSIVIGAAPIRTSDFHLSKTEKDYLIEVGRHAALEFLSSPSLRNALLESREKLEALRVKVDRIRRKRSHKKWAAVLLPLLAIGALVVNILQAKVDIYTMAASPLHVDTYVDSGGYVRTLEKESKCELLDFTHKYGEGWADHIFSFDSVVQFVLTNYKSRSVRVIVWDGIYRNSDEDRKIRLELSSKYAAAEIVGYTLYRDSKPWRTWLSRFSLSDSGWEQLEDSNKKDSLGTCVEKTPGGSPDSTEFRIGGSRCSLEDGDHIRLVEVATYDNVFGLTEKTIPWVLFAHKGVDPEKGHATYIFLTEEPESVNYLDNQLYLQIAEDVALHPLKPSQSRGIGSAQGRDRIDEATRFLKERIAKDPPATDSGKLENPIKAVVMAAEQALPDKRREAFVLQFDANETSEQDIKKHKVIVFAKSSSDGNQGDSSKVDRICSDTQQGSAEP